MSRAENLGQREELRIRRKSIEAEIISHCESIRHSLPLTAEPMEIDSKYIMRLSIRIDELKHELKGVVRKIEILERDLGII
ncbi:hypothetical protein [uncultured Desulfovibrio sp.]|uniref:hypothetical protein n=1 Tax=uncultured Desulfovibrio sp. TaxID=167968 RepID=UPI00260B395F|nr:hypothetical protein [uncultured Desulfovibrio sp.]